MTIIFYLSCPTMETFAASSSSSGVRKAQMIIAATITMWGSNNVGGRSFDLLRRYGRPTIRTRVDTPSLPIRRTHESQLSGSRVLKVSMILRISRVASVSISFRVSDFSCVSNVLRVLSVWKVLRVWRVLSVLSLLGVNLGCLVSGCFFLILGL